MHEDEICERFLRGLQRFLAEDMQLLQFDVNERCIGAALSGLTHSLLLAL